MQPSGDGFVLDAARWLGASPQAPVAAVLVLVVNRITPDTQNTVDLYSQIDAAQATLQGAVRAASWPFKVDGQVVRWS